MTDGSNSIVPAQDSRSQWLAALMLGVLLVLTLLIASWFLRACAPVDPSTSLTTRETPAPPAPLPPPDPTPVLKAALAEGEAGEKQLAAELAVLQAEFRDRIAGCKPVEVPKPAAPPPPPVAKAPPAPLPADRWAQKDLGMLQGCWRLGRDTQGNMGSGGRPEACAVKAGRICFQANGTGERQTTAVCPSSGTLSCSAPITARFGSDSTLGTTQPVVSCSKPGTSWNGAPNSLTCRRVSDTLALCRDRLGFEHEFRRE